jgi:hypothetical protein
MATEPLSVARFGNILESLRGDKGGQGEKVDKGGIPNFF